MPAEIALTSTHAFADALLWNWIIAGTDAHAKNYSLLLSGKDVRLAPFYDVASALPYAIGAQKLRLAMKLGNDYLVNPLSSPWHRLAANLGLAEEEVRARATRLLEVAADSFAAAADDPAVRGLGSQLPGKLTDLVAARARTCALLVGS